MAFNFRLASRELFLGCSKKEAFFIRNNNIIVDEPLEYLDDRFQQFQKIYARLRYIALCDGKWSEWKKRDFAKNGILEVNEITFESTFNIISIFNGRNKVTSSTDIILMIMLNEPHRIVDGETANRVLYSVKILNFCSSLNDSNLEIALDSDKTHKTCA